MSISHHQALLAGYAIGIAGWLVAQRMLPGTWPARPPLRFAHPWREFLLSIVAGLSVIGIGQLYQRDWLLPKEGALGLHLFDTINQVLMFSPMILLLILRRQPPATAWLPTERVAVRVACGILLAGLALLAFAAARTSMACWPSMVASVYLPEHLKFVVHVFLEDLSIAILFVRLLAAIPRPTVVAVVVSALFAGGHVPGSLADGATLVELAPLLLDFTLGVGILLVLSWSRDIWWFWCVHFAMDMTQFLEPG